MANYEPFKPRYYKAKQRIVRSNDPIEAKLDEILKYLRCTFRSARRSWHERTPWHRDLKSAPRESL